MEPDFDPFDSASRKEATKTLAVERIEARILSVLVDCPEGVPGNVLRQKVEGRKVYVDLALRSLWDKKRVVATPRAGRGGGVLWGLPGAPKA